MLFSLLLGALAACAILPALLFCINLFRFQPPPALTPDQQFAISVLIPARNEEANIGEALRCVLQSRNADLEVLVWDDDSADRTVDIVNTIAEADPRVRLLHGQTLPAGWNGKQHACWRLAEASTHNLLAFLDADVRIEPELLARTAAFRAIDNKGLVSGFPRLITVTWLEQLLLPLIHFVLLAFLPMRAMRKHLWPSAAAGCGQFLMVDRTAYFAAGGHSAIRETMHDGLLLPRKLRHAGFRTDIADITSLASVRMYDSASKVWSGLAKNATEGIATPAKIVPLTAILFLGQVLPALIALYLLLLGLVLAVLSLPSANLEHAVMTSGSPWLMTMYLTSHGAFAWRITNSTHFIFVALVFSASLLCVYLPRLIAVRRFKQPLRSALLHPLGVLTLLILQWYALARKLFGRPVGWRQRLYSNGTGTEAGSEV